MTCTGFASSGWVQQQNIIMSFCDHEKPQLLRQGLVISIIVPLYL